MGLDAFAMLREFGIDPLLLQRPEAHIPANAVSDLLAESARRSGCEAFGLLLAEKRSFSSLGPLSLLLRHESSLRTVLHRLTAYRRLVSDILDFELIESGDEARIIISVTPDVSSRQCIELAMALTCRFLSGAIFGGWHPDQVHFRHPAPADLQVHQRVFRASLRFDSTFDGFLFPAVNLDRENAYANPGLAQHAQEYVDLLSRELPVPSLAEQVRSAIKRLLPQGTATLPKVAAELNMHPRTLQRKLAVSGLAFADLVETIRQGLAQDLLANTNLPITQVALLVGYASPASFSRWFAGAAGQPPRQWRLDNRPRSAA
ncbi:MAG TPA: AraC family transcriptional regulator [Allosphingosinicella sp.]